MFDGITIARLVAVGIAAAACVTDLRSKRIPNALTFGGALAGVAYQLATSGPDGALSSIAGWAVGALMFFLPFALGGLGGGDVKLVAALGAWLGPMGAFWLGMYTGIAGGLAALALGVATGYLATAFANIRLLLTHWRVMGIEPVHAVTLEGSNGPRLAYAVPIFGGLLATIWFR